MNLHSILGGSRIQKNKKTRPTKQPPSSSSRLTDLGPAPIHTLPNTLQAHQHTLSSMFDPIPQTSGLTSTQTAHILHSRLAIPPVTSTRHIQALLSLTPTAAERDLSSLIHTNTVRRITVPRRGDLAILTTDLETLLDSHATLTTAAATAFKAFLRANPAAQTLPPQALPQSQIDTLVRAGFLTALLDNNSSSSSLRTRPDKHYTHISLTAIARAAAGTMAAVGGDGALHSAGGSGVRGAAESAAGLTIAVPGMGAFLKLAAAARAHLRGLLDRAAADGEMAERDLRARWDGGDPEGARAKRARGEFASVLPARTKKWRELHGLTFEWVLGEAVGAGMVELFDTGSVGRGVRLVGDGGV
ncbi:serine-threonine protein kinase 19 [Podospora appendiculata]|uniref:Serine-threonine protein kinase 19 n=1 Tax=Podospora appendiculata TaxID=314037 RepID=A0AAE1CHP8_9PEZI|nr:serine-threonine protein kinase 19 [Podospora appendiculata]